MLSMMQLTYLVASSSCFFAIQLPGTLVVLVEPRAYCKMSTMYILWPMAYGIWPMAYGIWPTAYIIRHTAYSIWPVAYGLQHTAYIRHMAFGLRHMAYGLRHTAIWPTILQYGPPWSQ